MVESADTLTTVGFCFRKGIDMPTKDELKLLQSYSLELKIAKTQQRIREWVKEFGVNGVYVSFSGGKDSTVLLDIVRKMYGNDIEAVFVDTGLEYPEIRQFVKTFENVTILRPKMRFDEVIKTYGYPLIGKKQADTISGAKKSLRQGVYTLRLMELGVSIEEAKEIGLKLPSDELLNRYTTTCNNSKFVMSKYKPLLFVDFDISHYCCNVMKKSPMGEYQKKTGKVPITAQMTEESMLRETAWLKNGCNAFEAKHQISNPMSFWTEQDIYHYIVENNLPIASPYGEILYRDKDLWGCVTAEMAKEFRKANCSLNLCTSGCDRTGCIFCGFGCHLDTQKGGESRFARLKRTHPRQYDYCLNGGAYDTDGLWKPTKEGLGMKHCFDVLNDLYSKNGKKFIEY